MSQDAEPSILEYARFYGLIQNHLANNPLQHVVVPRDFELQLNDTTDLFQIRNDCVKVPKERLAVDAGTASLLTDVANLAQFPPPGFDTDDELDHRRVRRMKHELPLLSTDHEVDMLRFTRKVVPNLENEFLPQETVDEEADGGFNWPSSLQGLPGEYNKRAREEKPVFPKEALIYLQETLKHPVEGFKHAFYEEIELLPHKKTSKVEPVSPPLLPMSPVTLPFVPSSDTCELELLSDITSPTRDEAREVEREIFNKDAILPTQREAGECLRKDSHLMMDSCKIGEIYSPLKGIEDPLSSPQTPKVLLQSHKVDVPLSPPTSAQLPPWKSKSVSWKETLTEVIQGMPLAIPNPEEVSSDDIDAFFEETIRPIGIKAERSIEQEQLQEADTTLRATVPVMDFSLPLAPWRAIAQDSKANQKDCIKKALTDMKSLHFNQHFWPISGRLDRELKWTPFPAALGKVETQESISDNGFVEKYLIPPEQVDVETLTWKPDGLRIFDELAESDEELEEGTFPEEKGTESLVRKRKAEMEDFEDHHPQSDAHSKVPRTEASEKMQETLSCNPLASFSALNALDKYMGVMQGTVDKPKLTTCSYFTPTKTTVNTDPPKDSDDPNTRSTESTYRPMPSPAIDVPTFAVPFVISASFLSQRKLARLVQRLFPSAELVERDFNLYQEPQHGPLSKPNANFKDQTMVVYDADIILSPSTGLITTTLQKIKQRSLPGQAVRSAVRERIKHTASRYERLVVLVCEDRRTGTSLDVTGDYGSQLGSGDCEAFVEFTSFCSAVQSEVLVTFVAGNEDDLARWIVAMMVKYRNTDPSTKLIQDETVWEVFLRRAGMNAFAAQAILGCLKANDHTERGDAVPFGLTALIKMPREERFARFDTLLGGREVLGRVSRVLDARW